ncbi:dienelactone hydrolase family protein [Sphingobium boeckii]|uniref:Carboxymethylenebutenolidase n=1 Tax=Sphingobium boeckii TaxID=1082345 RepID=A0A7W9ALT4_9SPHN|nr:dienelactone hydrolase family protein [Sphingobium boeckii]MBB5687759.1 carboxymethylenebutenolidase [Sphingobium boeckii]
MKPWLLGAIAIALPVYAQNSIPAPGVSPSTYASHQSEQAWATAKLAKSPRRSTWVKLQLGDRTLRAFVTFPQTNKKVPVVLVLHEVFGLTESTRNTADQIAAMGYITIAPDMVSGQAPNGGGVASFENSTLTSATVTGQSHQSVNAQIDAWADYGLKLPHANGKLALVGLSWGGGATFRYATYPAYNPALKAAFVFYDIGPPIFNQGPNRANNPPLPVDTIKVPIYGFYPTKDTRVMNSLQATKDAMAKAGKAFDPVLYENADHAYMRYGEDPRDPNPANKAAVEASMARLKALLAAM